MSSRVTISKRSYNIGLVNDILITFTYYHLLALYNTMTYHITINCFSFTPHLEHFAPQ